MRLRQAALDERRSWENPERNLLVCRAWKAAGKEADGSDIQIRRARATAAVLRGLTPVVGPNDLVVGKACMRPITPEEEAEVSDWQAAGRPGLPPMVGMDSHMAIDFPLLLRCGLDGVRRTVAEKANEARSLEEGGRKGSFYRACLIALDGLIAAADNYACAAGKMAAEERDFTRAAELREIARVCAKVPRQPAGTFREAVQSVHFVNAMLTLALPGLYQLGRPDRYLWPFYAADLESGRITRPEAQELWDCVSILFNECVPGGLAVGYMIGGRDAEGRDVSNELTEIMLESIGHVRLAYPGVGLCRNSGTPNRLVAKAAELLAQGCSHPAIFNDEIITSGLANLGLLPEEACEYVQSTCVEITPVACSGVWVASPYINLLQLLQDALGVDGQPRDYPSFQMLLDSVRERLRHAVAEAASEQNALRLDRSQSGGQPLVSCFVKDCIQRGVDIDRGGARHNWLEMSFVGLSNLVDALAAIRCLVFERREIALPELTRALTDDFEGCEPLRLRLLNKCPKYGNDSSEVDDLAVEITQWVGFACAEHRVFPDSAVVPGFFCWVMHEHLGRQTAASADGRRAGFALGDGSGPAQGRERKGPTAAVLSTTRWNHEPMLGGIAMNLKFTPDRDRSGLAAHIANIVTTYCDLGGFEIQVNVVDNATLRAAQKDPQSHRDLVVRIGGYSDYFVALSPGMQEEVIARSANGMRFRGEFQPVS